MVERKNKIAFLVVCWNNRAIIDECLKALQKQTYGNADIYVIDNASSDGTAEFIKEAYREVKLLASNVNHGFAKGNNLLIKEALKDPAVEYVALINSDAMLEKNWAKNIISFIKNKPNVAAAQGITLDYYNRDVIDAAHIFVRDDFQSVQYGYLDSFSSKFDYPRKVFGVNAAAAMYSRAFIEAQRNKVLFDEKFFMYLEDVDVSFRALMTGWDNYYVPSAKAYHMGSASSKKRSSSFNIQWTVRNQSALLFKNMPLRTLVKFFVNGAKFERHLYRYITEKYSPEDAKKVRKSRWIGLARLPLYISDRWWVYRHKKLSASDLERIIRNEGIV